jgi:hypothetical protein
VAPEPVIANRQAPVFAEDALEVAADAETIWDIMSDFERWPTWNRDVRDVVVEGPVAVGTTFRWRAGPGTIRSTLETVERPRYLAWTGKTLGIKAVHVWRIEPSGAGSRIAIEESWEGLMARLGRRSFQKTLQKACSDGLRMIKAEAERRVSTGAKTTSAGTTVSMTKLR